MDNKTPKNICGAKRKKTEGKVCQLPPVKGRTRCRFHGGASLSGIASPTFKHGRYSKVLPTGLRKKFEQAGRDPFLLSHEPELKLLDVKLSELVQALGGSGGPHTLKALKERWQAFETARASNQTSLAEVFLTQIKDVLESDDSSSSLWQEILMVIETRRRLLESESKRLKDQQQTMQLEQLLAIIEFLVDVIRTSVNKYADPDTAQKILSEVSNSLRDLVHRPTSAANRPLRLLS